MTDTELFALAVLVEGENIEIGHHVRHRDGLPWSPHTPAREGLYLELRRRGAIPESEAAP